MLSSAEKENLQNGCTLPAEVWARINRTDAFSDPQVARLLAPFPPRPLMQIVSGLTSESDFASHGADIWLALSKLAPKPLSAYNPILDLGCGCGRLGRMFIGHPGEIHGCDIDRSLIEWMSASLPYYSSHLSKPDVPLYYANGKFELIISISIFSHLNEASQDFLLEELHRISSKHGVIMLSIHGDRAMQRALAEKSIWDMLSMDKIRFDKAKEKFDRGEMAFVLQNGHLTTSDYAYGITFLPNSYISSHWGKWFNIVNHASGAIHDFQDVVVMTPK